MPAGPGVDRSGMKGTAGVMELQLGGLKLDNIDCLEPLALQIEVSRSPLSHPTPFSCCTSQCKENLRDSWVESKHQPNAQLVSKIWPNIMTYRGKITCNC